MLLRDGQFPCLDGIDTYELAQESVADALDSVYAKLDSAADAKRAETIVMPSTIVPAAAVPVSEGTCCIQWCTIPRVCVFVCFQGLVANTSIGASYLHEPLYLEQI